MRLIDADALTKALKEHFSDEDDDVELIEIGACWYHGAVLEKIDNAPTVEVVRCKDCKYCADDYIDVGMGTMPQFTCEIGKCGESVQPDDYCSFGEMQGEE